MGKTVRRFALIIVATLVVSGVSSARASAATPPTLSGESFAGAPSVTGICTFPDATVNFTASGVATGPYAGQFTASGTITYGAPGITTPGARPITSLVEQFTIVSPAGLVTGTKRLIGTGGGSCYGNGSGTAIYATIATYEAQIQTPSGTFTDHGQATIDMTLIPSVAIATFAETFTSDLQVISDLIATVQGLGLSSGAANSLTSKLNAALSSASSGNPTAACNQLGAFINEVNAAAKTNKISSADAATLIGQANGLRAALGCT